MGEWRGETLDEMVRCGVGAGLSNTLMFPNTRRLWPYKTEETRDLRS